MCLWINAKEYALRYEKYLPILEEYSNEIWIADFEESKSISGYIFTLGGIVISWKSSKQTCIARSIVESEFVALDNAREEAEWHSIIFGGYTIMV